MDFSTVCSSYSKFHLSTTLYDFTSECSSFVTDRLLMHSLSCSAGKLKKIHLNRFDKTDAFRIDIEHSIQLFITCQEINFTNDNWICTFRIFLRLCLRRCFIGSEFPRKTSLQSCEKKKQFDYWRLSHMKQFELIFPFGDFNEFFFLLSRTTQDQTDVRHLL